jgi:imidazolonepropionase-like amidohydrolase
MRAPAFILTFLSASLLCARSASADDIGPASPSKPASVIYRDGTLIDSNGEHSRVSVRVSGERITRVARYSPDDPNSEPGARVVDLHGEYIMAGLIDSHVHLATPPNRRQAEALLRRDIYGGVTAVRDMADDLRAVGELARESLVGEIAGSDIYYAALMAGPGFFSDKRTALTTAGASPGKVPWMQAITPASDLPLAVAQAKGTYATAIKLYADLDADIARRITAEAHRQGLLVWAHATLYPARPSDVVDAAVDAISHACLLVREPDAKIPSWLDPRDTVDLGRFRDADNPALSQLFKDMVRRGTILDATVWAYGAPPPGPSSAPPLAPGSCDDIVGGTITKQAFRAGVAIASGTDNVAPASDPWPDLFHELAALNERAEMPPIAVLKSATLIGARAAGQERTMGSIEPGKLANMIVLTKDPTVALENLKSIVMTIKRGRVYERRDFVPLKADDITDF